MAADPIPRPRLTAAGPAAVQAPTTASTRLQVLFWAALAVAVSLGFAVRVSRAALANPLVVHDDVRQHVFWVPRLHDRSLFAGDWIADYYQAQAPVGYQAVYWLLTLAVDAVLASKLLPLVLTTVLALGGFALGCALWRRSDAAALGAILLVWVAWHYDDVASATPRAYALPLLTLLLAALAAGRWPLALVLLPVMAVFYPLGCALATVTIGLWMVWAMPFRRLAWLAAATLLALGLVALGQRDAARYGPTVSAAEARTMPEFQAGGRAAFFVPDWYVFWVESSRSGLALRPKDTLLAPLPALTIPLVLATVLSGWAIAGRAGWLTPPGVPAGGALLLVLLAASTLLFGAAHLLLFALYLPSRHVQFSLPIVCALAGAFCWTLLGERLLARGAERLGRWVGLSGGGIVALAGIVLLTLHAPPPGSFYVIGRYPSLYAYLRQTPPDTLVGALPADSNIVPLFGQRPILTSYEHALPYHPAYYGPLRARTEAFRVAYYAPTLTPLVRELDTHGVGVVVADVASLERRARVASEQPPALLGVLDRCGVLRERELVVLPATCIRAEALSG